MLKPAVLLALSLALGGLVSAAPATAQSSDEFFESRVRPVLAAKCADCHSDARRRGGFRVSSLEALLAGGRSGAAVIPGDPDNSLLMKVVRYQVEGMEMPEDAPPLTPQEIEGLAQWIRMDAPWPENAGPIVFAAAESGGLSPAARLFVDRVRPVLEQKCFTCHTSEERGGLRLDSRERMLQGGSRGPAILPGNPEQSLLVAALRHESPGLLMPRNGEKLSERELEGIVEWIRAGAEWADATAPLSVPRRMASDEERSFWSFRPLSPPAVPSGGSDWAKTDIDRLVLEMLRSKGLTPVGPADRRTLLRRASFDLTGLPPTPEETQAFLADDSPDAFARVVDRLLASDHYGERWARHWLDVTRFGEDDTRGLARDGSGRERYPNAYLHRDWVVDAFNDDMPWGTFVKAHLAADLMEPEVRDDLLPALGFLGQGPWYYDIAEPAIARADERHDRVDVTTRGFMGLTVGCARCHDHKYDPIGTHDYYALAGIFNNANYYEYPLTDSVEAAEFKREQEFIEDMEKGLGEYLSTEATQLATVLSLHTSRYMMAAFHVTGKEQIPVETAASRDRLDLEVLQRWVRFLAKEPKHYPFVVPWQQMIADPQSKEEDAQKLADGFQRLILEVVAEQAKLEERNSRIIAKGTPLEDVKSTPMPNGFESFFDEHQLELDTMDRERLNLLTDLFRTDLDNEIDTFFRQPGLFRFSGWGLERQLSRVSADHVAAMREQIKKLEEDLPDIPIAMGVRERDPEEMTDIGVHIRGSPKNLGEAVPRGFPLVLQEGEARRYTEGSGRLELAEDIAAHPLTARVIVNRVWAWHMGGGIVPTPSNFGFAGLPPTNPDLLEYLAQDFLDHGMSIKRLHRQIMLSSVYQLASDDNPAYASIDPDNQYFWRFNRQRLGAEGIRDALLAAAGTLDSEIGGPSLPIGDEKNTRRTLYGEVSRFQLDEFLQTFDFPSPSLSAERRFATNVPLQSLYFMNSDFVHRQADAFVRRLAKLTGGDSVATAGAQESGSARSRRAGNARARGGEDEKKEPEPPARFDHRAMIQVAYPILFGREVTDAEVEVGLAFLETQKAEHLKRELALLVEEQDGDVPSAPVAGGAGAVEGSATPAGAGAAAGIAARELAERRAAMKAWVQYGRALFSSAEFRFIN